VATTQADPLDSYTATVSVPAGTDQELLLATLTHGIDSFIGKAMAERVGCRIEITGPDGTPVGNQWDTIDLVPDTPPTRRRHL
jgi:hypothetical protein